MENLPTPLRLTRNDLYERVWSKPIIRLAEEFGITNFLLTGVCRRYEIPTPRAGYWSKVAHDKGALRPELTGDGEALIALGRVKTPGFRASKPGRSRKVLDQPGPSTSPPKAPVNQQPSATVHSKVAKTVMRLRAASRDGLVPIFGPGCFKVTASVALADRVETVLDRLLSEVEGRGWRIKAGDKRLELDVEGEPIGFELIELTDRKAHVQTEAETIALSRYEARLAQARRTGAYVSPYDAPRIAVWDHVPNGKLSLLLDEVTRYRGVRRTFSDRKKQQVETLIDCVIEALAGYAAGEKQRRLDQEQARLQAEEDRRQREILKKLEQIEARRAEFAERQIVRLEKLDRVTALIAHLGDQDLPSDTGLFREWLKGQAAKLREELSVERIELRLGATRLMHDDANVQSWIDVETGGYRSSV